MITFISIEDIPDYKLGETPEDLPGNNPRLYRLIVAKRALRAGYEDFGDPETVITDMLADLRHLCDAVGLEFHACDRMAYAHYTDEKHHDENCESGVWSANG